MLASYIPAQPSQATLKRRLKNGMYTYDDGELHKRCSRCRDYWPADTEFYRKDKLQPDGLHPRCKDCAAIEQRIRRQHARESQIKE